MPVKQTVFTKEQIKAFQTVAEVFDNEQELMIGLKAIRVDEHGDRYVIMYEGLTGTKDPITGYTFTNDFPFSLYQKLVTELEKKSKRKKYAERMTLEHLKDTALTLNKEEYFETPE